MVTIKVNNISYKEQNAYLYYMKEMKEYGCKTICTLLWSSYIIF